LISIVDDDAFVGESLRDLIESLGYDVAIFDSAERFLEAACLGETSCLITDLQMPGLSGLDLQSRLIADGHCIPVVFVTGFPDENFPSPRDERRSCGLSEETLRRKLADQLPGKCAKSFGLI
jgi:FixJ family two-component response regulator